MANSWCNANCPIDCDDTLIVVPDFGCETPNNEEVTELFWSNSALVSGLVTEWSTRLSNSVAGTANTIRSLKISGNIPRVDPAFKTSKKGASVPQETEKVLTFTYEDDKDSAFAFFKTIECGMTKLFWFRSGPHIYGKLIGIYGTLIASYEINNESDLMAHNWQMQFRFKSKCFPDRDLAVI